MINKLTVLLVFVITIGCTSATSKPSVSQNVGQPDDITFTISSFTLEHTEDTFSAGDDESYDGTGIITVSGDAKLTQKPYLVLVHVKKVSGGDQNSVDRNVNVIVSKGLGKFETSDFTFKEGQKMVSPQYEITIIGYMKYEEITSSSIR